MLKPNITPASNIKLAINVGATFDIPTGTWVQGKHGESILLGGLLKITGIVGPGNVFKTAVANYLMLSAASRISRNSYASIQTYDTEMSFTHERASKLLTNFDNFKDRDLFSDGSWLITDKTVYLGNEWWEEEKKFLLEKMKSKEAVTTPFRENGEERKVVPFSFFCIDSMTEFETADDVAKLDANELGDAGRNTFYARQGLVKSTLLAELPRLCEASNNYCVLVTHLGKEMAMAQGPFSPPPEKKLQFLKQGETMKGVGPKFYFSTNHLWKIGTAKPMINTTSKLCEYPITPKDESSANDLMILTLIQLRSKSGPSGYTLEIVASQTEGVQPTLTEFHMLRSNGRWGMTGSDRSYCLDLLPDITIMRTTVRSLINDEKKGPKFRRAMNITAELYQMHQFQPSYKDYLCTPKELYEDLKKQGYDWDVLLNTRGWWTVDNDSYSVPFLSTMDLLRMRKGEYKPYWMKDKKGK